VMVRETQPYKCWLVMDLNPMACFKNTVYDLWEVVPATAGESNAEVPALSPSPTPAPTPPPTPDSPSRAQPSESLGTAWAHHEGYNCFGGQGATGVAGKSPIAGDHFLPTCKAACEAEPECEGIVMVRETQPYKCWLVMDLNPMACFKNTAYDLWEVVPATASEHNIQVPALSRQANVYEHVSGVGAWGGWCTCPDGQRYNVGDLFDGCANGPHSLACYGGTPGECTKAVDETRNGMKVTCAAV